MQDQCPEQPFILYNTTNKRSASQLEQKSNTHDISFQKASMFASPGAYVQKGWFLFNGGCIILTFVRSQLFSHAVAELQDRVDSLEQYSRRNNVRISGIPESTGAAENTDAVVKKVGEAIGVAVTDEMIDRSRRVGKPGKMGRDILVKFTSYRRKYLIMKARSNLKNKDAALLGVTSAGATRQPVSAAGAATTPVPSPAGGVYVKDDLTRETSSVAARARRLKRDKKIKDTWVRDGEICVKMKNDSTIKPSTNRQLAVFD